MASQQDVQSSGNLIFLILMFRDRWWSDMRFVKKFTPPDFWGKIFTPLISPNFNSLVIKHKQISKKRRNLYCWQKIVHCRQQWRQWQISSLFQDGNIITVHRWLIFMYLHHFISTDAAVTIDIIEVKRPDNLRRKILIEEYFVRRTKFRLSKLPPLLCQYNTTKLSHKQTVLWQEFKPYPSETLCL